MRLALLAPLLASAAVAASDTALLPPAGTAPGFVVAGPARVFTGSALYGHIDGGAEIFFEFGFEEAAVQRYAKGAGTVEVELYRMADPTAALGIYLARCGARCEAPGTHAGFPAYTTVGRAQVAFVQERYFVVVTGDGPGLAADGAVPAFASAVTKRLPADRAVDPAAALPAGWSPGSVRVIRGPLALQAIITLGEGDVLLLGGKVTAAAAEYPEAPGRPAHTLVLAEYPDGAAARAALAHLRAGLDPEIKLVREMAGAFAFRDYAGKFGTAAVDGSRLALRLNLGRDPDSP